MIDQEKFLCVQGVAFRDDDERVLEALGRWERGTQWQKLDCIRTTEEELAELIDKMCSAKDSSSDLIVNPALEEFTIRCVDDNMATVICFRRSVMFGEKFVTQLSEDTVSTLVPYIDAYVYLNNDGVRQDAVIVLGRSSITNGKDTITCSTQQAIWARRNGLYQYMCETDKDSEAEFPRNVKLLYMAVQHTFYNRPEVFLHSTARVSVANPKAKNKKSHDRTKNTRTVKIIHIDYEALTRVPSSIHYQLSCPCWGVAGHWRKYNSGKRIWIKPYRKGKERDNSEKYYPKNYSLCEEVINNA